MVVYRREIFHVRRMPNGGPQHASECRSHALLDSIDPPEESEGLYYPRARYLESGRAASGAPVELSARATAGARRSVTPLRDIFLLLWKRAGLCRWSPGWRARPWRAVAHALREAAGSVVLGDGPLSERLVLLGGGDGGLRKPEETTTVAPISLAIGPIAFVRRTTRDIIVAPWGTERFWCENPAIENAHQEAASRKDASGRGYVVGILALYHQRSWRCTDWDFLSLTHAWHPYFEASQAQLYEELVRTARRFSIPRARELQSPWAVLWDAEGGPRAVIPELASGPTVHPPWRWRAGGPLPRVGPSARPGR